jgi:hypothetical protein
MDLFPDEPPPPSPPAKPKLTAEERRARMADRLTMIRLLMAIWQALDDQGIATMRFARSGSPTWPATLASGSRTPVRGG